MVDGIKISALPAVQSPSLAYEIPAILNGATERLSVQQVANLVTALIVNGSPAALDTLKELATALGNDANFATTVNNAIAARLKKDGTEAMSGPLNLGGNELKRASNLVGMVAMFVGTTPPAGWIKLNGATLTRASYPDLWAYAQASGSIVAEASWAANSGKFSTGNTTTTFRIPDLRGEFPRFWDDARGVDSGRALGVTQAAYAGYFNIQAGRDDGDSSEGAVQSIRYIWINGNLVVDNGQGGPVDIAVIPGDNRPRNMSLMPCMKY